MRASLDELTFHVMNTTADDWESLETIMPEVEEFVGIKDWSPVAHAIVELVTEGLFEEMKNKTVTPETLLQAPKEYWFSMTKKVGPCGILKALNIRALDENPPFHQVVLRLVSQGDALAG